MLYVYACWHYLGFGAVSKTAGLIYEAIDDTRRGLLRNDWPL